MTSITACIDDLIARRLLTREQGEGILQEELFAREAGVENPAQAALANARAHLTRQKYLAALQAQVIGDLLTKVQSHPKGIARGVQSVLARDLTTQARWSNVDARHQAIQRQFTAQIAEAMDAMRLTRVGLHQDRELIDNVVRELFGESTGNADAARFAKAVGETFEAARVRFNAAGGDIPKRADWGMPQHHDARRVQDMGRDAWKAFIRPRLDPARMLGQNGLPLPAAELDKALDAAFETITTHGLNKLVPGTVAGKKLANQHQDHRFLVFKNADAWLEYDRELGGGNPYFTMMGHLDGMAGNIALLEIMGPNPTHAMRVLRDTAKKQGVEGLALDRIDALWRTVSGSGDGAATLSLSTVETLQSIRNWLTSMKLGSALLSAPSDLAFMRHAAAWNGLSSMRAINTFLSLLNPANAADRLRAVQLGLTAEAWTGLALHANRFAEVTGHGVSARAADVTMRASGLSHWTDAAQKAIGFEWLTRMAELRTSQWADLPIENRRLLEETGFVEADWDVIRHAPLDQSGQVARLDLPKLLQKRPTPEVQRAVNRAMEAIQTLTHLAIPSPDAQARSIAAIGGGRGTLGREVANFVLQFKSFPMAVILSHVYRGIHQGAAGGFGAYLGSLAIATTVMGALAMNLREIAKGRTPRDMSQPEAWVAAFVQGGGAGIFGDFVNSGMFGVNRFGGSMAETLTGPAVGAATDAARLTLGQFGETIEGKDNNLGTDVVNALGGYTPVVGSLWYTRLAYERWVLNQLQLQVDPNARQKYRQDARRRLTEQGTRYWWRRGQVAPD